MSADKHPAEVLADSLDLEHLEHAEQLRRIPALEAERDTYRARLDRAIAAAETHFGEDAIRYKLSLFQNGRARNVFPQSMDGRWVALQRADDDAHIGLSLRVVEAEAERDRLSAEVKALRADAERMEWLCFAPALMVSANMPAMREWLIKRPAGLNNLRDAIDVARKQQ